MQISPLALLMAAALASAACDQTNPLPMEPSLPSPLPIATSGVISVAPAMNGVVREANGGPIADARIYFASPAPGPTTFSAGDGTYALPAGDLACHGSTLLQVVKDGFMPRALYGVQCRPITDRTVMSQDVTMQRVREVSVARPATFPLSNDDLDLGSLPVGDACGPCASVWVDRSVSWPVDVHVEWTGGTPLTAWIVASDAEYEDVLLVKHAAQLGENAMTFEMPRMGPNRAPRIKVGLPIGSRAEGGVPSTIDVHMTLLP